VKVQYLKKSIDVKKEYIEESLDKQDVAAVQETNKTSVEVIQPPSISKSSSSLCEIAACTKNEFVQECNVKSSEVLKKDEDIKQSKEIDYSQPLDLSVKRNKSKVNNHNIKFEYRSNSSWEAATVPRQNGSWHKNKEADFWMFSRSNDTVSSGKTPASSSIYEQFIEKSICSSLQNCGHHVQKKDVEQMQSTKTPSQSLQKNTLYPTNSKGLPSLTKNDRKIMFGPEDTFKTTTTNYAKHLKPVIKSNSSSVEVIQQLTKHNTSDKNKLHYKQNIQSSKTYYRPASLLASHRTKKHVDSPESRLNLESENGEEVSDKSIIEEIILDSQVNLHLRSNSALSMSPSLAANGNSSKPYQLTSHSKTFSIPTTSYKSLSTEQKYHESTYPSFSSGSCQKNNDLSIIQNQKHQSHTRKSSLVEPKLNLSITKVEHGSFTKPEPKDPHFEADNKSTSYDTKLHAQVQHKQHSTVSMMNANEVQTKSSNDNSKDISSQNNKKIGNKQSIFYQNQLSEHIIKRCSPKSHQVSPLNKSSSLLTHPRQTQQANAFSLMNRRLPNSEMRVAGRPSTSQPYEMQKSPMSNKRSSNITLPSEKKAHYSHVHNKVLKNPISHSYDLCKRVDTSLNPNYKSEPDHRHHPRYNDRIAPNLNSHVSQRKGKELPSEQQKLQHNQLMSTSRLPNQNFIESNYALSKKTRPIERSEDLQMPKLPAKVNQQSLLFSVDRLTSPNEKTPRVKEFMRSSGAMKKQTVSPANISRSQMMFKTSNSTPPRQQIRQESPRTPIAFNPSIAAGSNAQLQSQLAASQRFSMPSRVMPGFPGLHQQQLMASQQNLQQVAQQVMQQDTQRAMLLELFKSMQQPRLPIQNLFQAGLMANFQQTAIRPDQLNSAAIPPQYFDPSIIQALQSASSLSGTPFLPFQNNQPAPNSNNRSQNFPYPN